jgi:hypothetical protein
MLARMFFYELFTLSFMICEKLMPGKDILGMDDFHLINLRSIKEKNFSIAISQLVSRKLALRPFQNTVIFHNQWPKNSREDLQGCQEKIWDNCSDLDTDDKASILSYFFR